MATPLQGNKAAYINSEFRHTPNNKPLILMLDKHTYYNLDIPLCEAQTRAISHSDWCHSQKIKEVEDGNNKESNRIHSQ